MTYVPVLCTGCARNNRNATCSAFPAGIPAAISRDGYDHREPFPGDQGLRFDLGPKPADAEALRDYLRFGRMPIDKMAEVAAKVEGVTG